MSDLMVVEVIQTSEGWRIEWGSEGGFFGPYEEHYTKWSEVVKELKVMLVPSDYEES